MSAVMSPAHVVVWNDAAVGGALRRVREVLPDGWYLELILHGDRAIATAAPVTGLGDSLVGRASDPADALDDLWSALVAREQGGHLHEWRSVDFGHVCITVGCGAMR